MKKTEIGKTEIGKTEISKVSVVFAQDGNTLGTTPEVEQIEISLEFQLGEKDGHFVVIKTEGWSMDNVSELSDLVKKAERVLE